MTRSWSLLLLALSCQSVDSQNTTRDDVHDDVLLRQEIEALSLRQQQILEQLQIIVKRLNTDKPRDCSEIYNSGICSDGIYTVYLGSARRPVEVYCDMTTDGGGWTVFQRRQNGSEDFYRDWNDYKTGFGNILGEFWLGNDNLHLLTSDKRQQLRIDLADFEESRRYAEYDDFRVDSACAQYKLTSLGRYSGTAGDALSYHREQKFSTRDQDNDSWPGSCAERYKGGWWYRSCHTSNLNGLYLGGKHRSYGDGVQWTNWMDYHYSLKFTEMKIRSY